MSLSAEWPHLLDQLRLPAAPAALVAAPDSDDALRALAEAWLRARLTLLDIAPEPRPTPAALVAHRIPLTPGSDLDLAEGSLDLAVFDHAIDDIVVEAVAHQEGIRADPPGDRGEYSPRLRAVRAYWRSGDLESVAAPALVRVVQSCLRALRPSARMVFHHGVVNAHLVGGHPFDLYTEYLLLARRWIDEAGMDLREVALDSFDPARWMCLQRAA